jgi:SAM-dependent methyltransferase
MDAVEETVKAYKHSIQDYTMKHMDVNVVKEEADLFLSKLEKGSLILDVGCGPGRDAKYFFSKSHHAVGIDLTPEFVELAKLNVPWGDFRVMDMRKMEFENNYFDGLWSMASLLHIPRNEADVVMNEYARVLKPKGVMFLSTMEGNGEDPKSSPKYGGNSKFFYRYTEEELRNLVNSAGFKIDDFKLDKKSETLAFWNVLATKNK